MKTRSLLFVMMVMIFIAIVAVPAQAGTNKTVFKDGSYAISESTATTIQLIGPKATSASGWGGTKASSGNRSAYITTTCYSILGTRICSVRTGVYWEWSKGHVQIHYRYAPTLTTYNNVPLVSITMTYNWGPSWHFTWNGKTDGGWYASTNVVLKQSVFKYGVLSDGTLTHEYKVQADGRYWWQATL